MYARIVLASVILDTERYSSYLKNKRDPVIQSQIIRNAKKYNIPQDMVSVYNDTYFPRNFLKRLEICYQNPDNIQKIWEISKCMRIVKEKRRRLVYKSMKVTDIVPDGLINDIQGFVCKIKPIELHKMLKHEAVIDVCSGDMITTLIARKEDEISGSSILSLQCLRSLYDKQIPNICVFNVMTGVFYNICVPAPEGSKLLEYVLSSNK